MKIELNINLNSIVELSDFHNDALIAEIKSDIKSAFPDSDVFVESSESSSSCYVSENGEYIDNEDFILERINRIHTQVFERGQWHFLELDHE